MRLHERSIVFDGVDLCEAYDLHYSKFDEVLPKKKLVTVSIPYGMDVDISDRLGKGGWTNGTHKLKFLLYKPTEAERLDARNRIVDTVHGRYADYSLTWDEEYTYRGRAKVTVDHRSENVDVFTIEIDRYPWKVKQVEEVIDLAYGNSPTQSKVYEHRFDKYKRYRNVKLTALTAVDGNWHSWYYTGEWDHYGLNGATNETVTDEIWQDDGKYWLKLVNGWLLWFDAENDEMVVSSSKLTISDGNAVIDGTYTITNGDMEFAYYDKQSITVKYEAWGI